MSYIISLIFGIVLGLVNNKTLKGLIYGKVELSKGIPHAYQTVQGYEHADTELLQGFRARFLGLAMLLLSILLGGLFWIALAQIKLDLASIYFYLEILAVALGIYLGIKLVKKPTTR